LNIIYNKQSILFKHPFKIAHGTRYSTDIVLIKIQYNGFTGYGEASLPPYLLETQNSVIDFIEKVAPFLKSLKDLDNLPSIIDELNVIVPNNTAAKAAIDMALHDISGKLQLLPCWKMFACRKEDAPFSTYTLGIDSKEVMEQKITEGDLFPYYKVKLDGENDEKIINIIRNKTNKPIAVDINQGWKDKYEALEKINWLKDKNVLFVEQPLPKNNWDDAYWLYEKSTLPIFADEAMQQLSDLEKVKSCYHGINIKLMKCGGLNEARKIISLAKQNNLKILMGCMTETSCAISAAAQLSPLVNYADLDGAQLIKNDFFDGITFLNGKILLYDLPGIGVVEKAV